MSLPTVLYRCPGPHSRAGGTWDYLGVETAEAHEAATAAGWHPSMPDAIAAYEGKKAEVIAEVEKEVKAEGLAVEVAAETLDDAQTAEVVESVVVIKPRCKPGPKPKHRG